MHKRIQHQVPTVSYLMLSIHFEMGHGGKTPVRSDVAPNWPYDVSAVTGLSLKTVQLH